VTDLPSTDELPPTCAIPGKSDPRLPFRPTRTRGGPVGSSAADYFPRVPGYRIEGRLGKGGMGVVYQAVQVALNRPVALKMLGGDHGPADADSRTRFRKEAEALASLRHPNVVPVYEVGEADGVPYFSMELVEGGTLAARLMRQPPTPIEAATLTAQLARGVHAAHEAGILHRDLKPSNVLLSADQGSRLGDSRSGLSACGSTSAVPNYALVPKVADFGIAKRFGAARGDDRTMTQAGDLLGTPAYMAPEQADGNSRVQVGPAADIYSIGALLYELLTRRPPFDAGDPIRTLMEVLNDDPTPPSRLVPAVPRDLETICLKCLQKDPGKRYPTAAALADDLDRFLTGQPISARPVSAPERVTKWARRHPATAAMLGVTALTIVAAFAGITWAWREADERAFLEGVARREESKALALAAERQRELEMHHAEVEYRAALGYVEAGLAACRTDEVARGLVYLTRGIEKVVEIRPGFPDPERLDRLDRIARTNLAAWQSKLVFRGRARFATAAPAKDVWILDLDISPDGTRVVTGNMDGLLRLYDAATSEEFGDPRRLGGAVVGTTFSPDGKRLLVIREDGFPPPGVARQNWQPPGYLARVWDPAAVRPIGPEVRITTVQAGHFVMWASAWLPDGRLALQNGPRSLHISADGDPNSPGLTITADMVMTSCAPVPGTAALVTGHADGTVRRWDLATGQETARTTNRDDPIFGTVPVDNPVFGLGLSADGSRLLTGHWTGRVRIYDARTLVPGPVIHTPAAIRSAADRKVRPFLRTADFSPDGRTVLVGGGTWSGPHKIDGYLRTYNAGTGEALIEFVHPEPVWGAAFASDGDRIVTACEDRIVRVFRAWDGTQLEVLQQSGNPGRVVVGRDGRMVFAGDMGANGAPLLGDLGPVDQPFRALKLTAAPVAMKFTADGSRLRVVDSRRALSEFDPRTGESECLPVGLPSDLVGVRLWSETDRADVWSGEWTGPNAKLRRFDVSSGVQTWELAPGPLMDVVALSDGGLVACPVGNQPVRCYEADGRLRWEAHVERSATHHYFIAAAVPGGPVLVGSNGRPSLTVLDPKTGKVAGPLIRLPGRVGGLEAHPTAQRVLISFHEGYCQELDVPTGKPVGAPIALRGVSSYATYAPDGSSVAVVGNELTRWQVDRYDLATGLVLGPPLKTSSPIQKLAFHPSGRLLAVAEQSGTVRFWELPGRMLGEPERLTCWAEMAGRVVLATGPHELVRFLDDGEVGARRKRLFTELEGEPTVEGLPHKN
jgi:eukaryotic-like serine/threonine-protein kinase